MEVAQQQIFGSKNDDHVFVNSSDLGTVLVLTCFSTTQLYILTVERCHGLIYFGSSCVVCKQQLSSKSQSYFIVKFTVHSFNFSRHGPTVQRGRTKATNLSVIPACFWL